MNGPLRAHSTNPRYFTDDDGLPIILCGSNTFLVQQDSSTDGTFDFTDWIDLMVAAGHNHLRYWNLDRSLINLSLTSAGAGLLTPMPWERTGPGDAGDGGGLKFDLSSFDQDYFDRMRARVIEAGNAGIYCQIMLWDAIWRDTQGATTWNAHPYNPANNVNGYSMTQSQCYTLAVSAWVTLMEAYVEKVVDTLNDLDNVLWEIANEAPADTATFQAHFIDHIHTYEAGKAKQHPVVMSGFDLNSTDSDCNTVLDASDADAVAYLKRTSGTVPPADAGASKVSIFDSDHTWGFPVDTNNPEWAWGCFCRGHNPCYLDCNDLPLATPDEQIRAALGYIRTVAGMIDLATMAPNSALASTTYCLANPGEEYLAYQPDSATFTVTLLAGTYRYRWINPANGALSTAGEFTASAGAREFTLPAGLSSGLLWLRKRRRIATVTSLNVGTLTIGS